MECAYPHSAVHDVGNLHRPLTGREMDVRDLKFDADSFDVAIDKGTMDAMMTSKGDVWVYIVFCTVYR